METQYWIQEQAPNGGFFDSVGLPPNTSEFDAICWFESWQASSPDRKVRLVEKVTKVINTEIAPHDCCHICGGPNH